MATRRQQKDQPLRIEESISMIARELPSFTDAVRDLADEVKALRKIAEREIGNSEENSGQD